MVKLPKIIRSFLAKQNPKDDVVIVCNPDGSFGLEVKRVDECPIILGQWYRELLTGRVVRVSGWVDGKILVDGRLYGIDAKIFKIFYRLEVRNEK